MRHGHVVDTWKDESHVSHHKEGNQFEWGRNGGEKRKRKGNGGNKIKENEGKKRKGRKSVRVKRKEREKGEKE